MKWIVLVATALVFTVGCKAKLESDKLDQQAEQQSCNLGMTKVPQDFLQTATAATAKAFKTENCDVVAVGTAHDNQPIIARYDRNEQLIRTFANNGIYRPLATHALSKYAVHLERLALIPGGIIALGWYDTGVGGDLLALKIKTDGILDFEFGPKRDGVIWGDNTSGQTVRVVDAPEVSRDSKYFSMLVTYYSKVTGTQYTKGVRLSVTGRDELPRLKFAIPGNCEIVNHAAILEGNSVRIQQNDCFSLAWIAQGRGVNDNFRVITDGTVYSSSMLGEFSMHYAADGRPILTSLDGLGNTKDEFMIFVEGRREICGQPTNAGQRYLVFSRKLPHQPDFLNNCWFM